MRTKEKQTELIQSFVKNQDGKIFMIAQIKKITKSIKNNNYTCEYEWGLVDVTKVYKKTMNPSKET